MPHGLSTHTPAEAAVGLREIEEKIKSQKATANVAKNVATSTKPAEAISAIRGAVGGQPLPAGSIGAEQKALKEFGRVFGRMPSSSEDWEVIHQGVYGIAGRPQPVVPQGPAVGPTPAPGAPAPAPGTPAPPGPPPGQIQPPGGGLQPSPGTAFRNMLPGPSEFTNLLKNVLDVKLGRKPFLIGIPDNDLRLLTPAAVRGELNTRANKLLAEGANVKAIMDSYQGMYKDTLNVADRYLKDLENRQEQFRELAFSEPVLTQGVLPPQMRSILSPQEQEIWEQMSKFYVTKFKQGQLPELITKDIDETTGQTILVFRDKLTGTISRQVLDATRSPDAKLITELIKKYPDAGILPTDSLPTAQSKLSSSRIYKQETRLADEAGRGISEVERWAQQVNEGKLEITNVPQSIRLEVQETVNRLATEGETTTKAKESEIIAEINKLPPKTPESQVRTFIEQNGDDPNKEIYRSIIKKFGLVSWF